MALVSQSGAFIVSRLSNLETLDPAFAISIGNQIDLTPADLLAAIGPRDDVDVIGVYAEGFDDLDGLALLRHIATTAAAGKDVVFYKAGRTGPGRSAAAGHTASVAGDYDVCQAAAGQAGALVADTFNEFEQLMELCAGAPRQGRGRGADRRGVQRRASRRSAWPTPSRASATGWRWPPLAGRSRSRLAEALAERGLGRLVNARNPLDLTPMADEEAYEDAVRVLLEADEVDAVVVGIVPLTAALKTVGEEVEAPGSLAHRLPALARATRKPMIVVVDSGPLYDPLVRALRAGGLPVFRSADQAVRSLGRYLCHRVEVRPKGGRRAKVPGAAAPETGAKAPAPGEPVAG